VGLVVAVVFMEVLVVSVGEVVTVVTVVAVPDSRISVVVVLVPVSSPPTRKCYHCGYAESLIQAFSTTQLSRAETQLVAVVAVVVLVLVLVLDRPCKHSAHGKEVRKRSASTDGSSFIPK
jgi:hypothetical protein